MRLEKMTLILKHANKNRLGAIECGPIDLDVFEGALCIGHLFLVDAGARGTAAGIGNACNHLENANNHIEKCGPPM
jgi:hypothetical protein